MVKNGTHTLWKIGLSLLLTLLMLLTGSVGIGEADGPGVQLSTLKIRVLDSTPQHKPKTGVELRIMLGEYVVDQQVSDEDGYIEFPLGSLQTNYYEITGDPGVAEYRIQDCALRLGRTDGGAGYLVSIDNMVPESADFCFDVIAETELFHVTFDANGGTIDGYSFLTFDTTDSHLTVGEDPEEFYAVIASEELDLEEDNYNNVSAPAGYEPVGWFTERVGGTEVEENRTRFYEEYSTIYARWSKEISFDSNGGSGSMGKQTFLYGEPQNLSQNAFTHPNGLQFAGWNTKADGTGSSYGDGQEITSPTFGTLYAQWVGEDVTVLLDPSIQNGTVAADDILAAAGTTVTLTLTPDTGCEYVPGSLRVMQGETSIPTAQGSGGTVWTFTMPEGRVTVSAEFARISYSIGFAPAEHGSVTVYQPQDSYHYADRITLTAAPDAGYELSELLVTDPAGNDIPLTNDAFTMPNSNVAVSATFTARSYPIRLNYKGNLEQAQVASAARTGDTVTVRSNTGYLITEMLVTGKDGTQISFTTKNSKELTFTMPPQEVTIRVNCSFSYYLVSAAFSSGGSVTGLEDIVDQTWPYGKVITFSVAPDTGRVLKEIKIVTSSGEEVPYDILLGGKYRFTLPASNVTIRVKFEESQYYTVSFYNGDTKLSDVKVEADETVFDEDRPRVDREDGQAFLGWYENDTYFPRGRAINRDVTLKAKLGPAVDSLKFHVTDSTPERNPMEGCVISIQSSDQYETFQTQTTDSNGYAVFDISSLRSYTGYGIMVDGQRLTKMADITYMVRIDSEEQYGYNIGLYDLRLIENVYEKTFEDDNGTKYVASFRDGNTELGPQACYEIMDEIMAVPGDYGVIMDEDGVPVSGDGNVILPAQTREIGDYAFENAAMFTVYVPDTCVSVGEYAFRGCRSLYLIRLPKNCEISEHAFSDEETVFVLAPAGGTTETHCRASDNLVFLNEQISD